ncbi:MAG: hypothetical protein J6V44_12815 [Methanobrevibacter sp.]|nr:hypothetical protein [Methanobrevibacter sp.]
MNKLDQIIESGFFYLYIGSLISADTIVNKETCEESLAKIEQLEECLETSTLADDKIKHLILSAKVIALKDLEKF